ncbi:cytochrome P450 [Kitasatospora cystarginea]|uniref:Cytochrome P450 n=1 Tax=Kitasatospora cystarginea TaxID=58350 RepID=A0ABP5R9W8_9ACTN
MTATPLAALHGPDFARDPQALYDWLRLHGPVVPVEIAPGIPAYLVIGYWAAREVLQNPDIWSKDPTIWAGGLPPDSPVLGMLGPRPNALFADGQQHARYRRVVTDCLARIEPHRLRDLVHQVADSLIAEFSGTGTADLVGQYARQLPLIIFNHLFGMPDERAPQLVRALAGLIEATREQAARATADFEQYLAELLSAKKAQRGNDLPSWLLDHPLGLTEVEVFHHIVLLVGAGNEPTTNLISNALSRMLSDDRYYSTLAGGALTTRHALEDVLRNEPPMANYGAHYPLRDTDLHGTRIPARQLVLVSYAAANTDPAGLDRNPLVNGGAHLAWSAGPHTCPAQSPAVIIASTAVEDLTSALPDLELAVARTDLEWRPGPFHRALHSLPVHFTPIAPSSRGAQLWPSIASRSTRPAATLPLRPPTSAAWAPPSR